MTSDEYVTAPLADLLASGEAADVQNVAITSNAGVQQMPSVAVDPLDADHVVIAYMDYSLLTTGYAGIGIAASTDGGATWQHSSIPLPPTFDGGASNPIAAFDDQGHVFVTFMAANFLDHKPPLLNPTGAVTDPVSGNPVQLRSFGFHANNGIFIARSDDAGLSWQPAAAVSSQSYDGINEVPFDINPDFVIDTISTLPSGQPNPRHGTFYVTFTRYYPRGKFPASPESSGGSHAQLAVSSDEGQSWQLLTKSNGRPVLEDADSAIGFDPGLGIYNYQHLAIGAEGDIGAAYFSGSWVVVNHSHDGGATFFVPHQNNQQGDVSLPFGPPALPTPFLENNRFRNVPMRSIAADPTRPGHLYVAEPLAAKDAKNNTVDAADIFFARSEDYGETWEQTILHGLKNDVVDDNGGQHPTGTIDDVIADQVMVKVRVNARGDVGLVWYDARRDPANHKLDVFGAVSSDGGESFSPNFRVTDESFDALQGSFTDAIGKTNYFIGDGLGLAMSNDVAYVAWTDTRAGNQDILFQRVPLNPVPDPPNDRFEPNNSAVAATVFGPVLTRHLTKLALSAGDNDWFQVQSTATGKLTAKVTAIADSPDIQLEIYDATGQQLLAHGSPVRGQSGTLTTWTAAAPAAPGENFVVRVSAASRVNEYSLDLEGLTANLGPLVYAKLDGTLQPGDKDYYLLEASAAGTVQAKFEPANGGNGSAVLEIIDRNDFTVLSDATGAAPELNYPVSPGQSLLLRVTSAADSGFQGPFSLQLTNLDQFASPGQKILHFPAGNVPSHAAVADFNRDGKPDVAVADLGSNVVSVSLGNGDGTFAAPRQFAVGAFHLPNSNGFGRDIAAVDFSGDGVPDLAVTNYDSADVSILIGRGDGTFATQQRYDAAKNPMRLAIGDVNGDGHLDLAVVDSPLSDPVNRLAVLLGRGDGTFLPQKIQVLPDTLAHASLGLADFNHDSVLDLIIGGNTNAQKVEGVEVFRGVGDGSFVLVGHFDGSRNSTDLIVADFNGDGDLDFLADAALQSDNGVALFYGDGNFGFTNEKGEPGTAQVFADVGALPSAVRIADWGSPIFDDDGVVTALGPPDGHPDLVVANSGLPAGIVAPVGPPNVVVLPALVDGQGAFTGFGEPQTLTLAVFPHDLEVTDLNGDGAVDIVVADQNDFFVIFGKPPVIEPNLSPLTARKLETVAHVVEPTLTITPQHSDAWYRLSVPTEVVPGAGDQILDFSGGFAHEVGLGLGMEVTDAAGSVLGSGERLRIVAGQGETLFVHVFGVTDIAGNRGSGAYTLAIDTLPQLVSVEAQSLLPGKGSRPAGPTTNVVIVFQGDRLDAETAENPANYRVTWLGRDGIRGTSDDRLIPVGSGLAAGQQSAVYDASSNIDVASGLILPTAIRQTVTLLFGVPLPVGSYEIEILPSVQSDPFNTEELDLVSVEGGFIGHPVVAAATIGVTEGSQVHSTDLVRPMTTLGDLSIFEAGTPFLSQFIGDLGALLDARLTELGDTPDITDQIIKQIVAHLGPALGLSGKPTVSLAVFFLDPPSIGVVDPAGKSFVSDKQTNTVANNLPNTYAGVAGNVTILAMANPQGIYQLKVADVGPLVRGGVVYFGIGGPQITLLTQPMRGGQELFSFQFGPRQVPIPPPPLASAVVASSPGQLGNILVPLSSAQIKEATAASTESAKTESGNGGDKITAQRQLTPPLSVWQQIADGLLKLWNEIRRRIRLSLPFKSSLLGGNLKPVVRDFRIPLEPFTIDQPPKTDLIGVERVESADPSDKGVEPRLVPTEPVAAQAPTVIGNAPAEKTADSSGTAKSEEAEPSR